MDHEAELMCDNMSRARSTPAERAEARGVDRMVAGHAREDFAAVHVCARTWRRRARAPPTGHATRAEARLREVIGGREDF